MYFRVYGKSELTAMNKKEICALAEGRGLKESAKKPELVAAILDRMKNAKTFLAVPGNPEANRTVVLQNPEGGRVNLEFRKNKLVVPWAPEFRWMHLKLWEAGYRYEPEELPEPEPELPDEPEMDLPGDEPASEE